MTVVVCQLLSVNLHQPEPKQLLLSNGNPAGVPLDKGDYVAIRNTDDQPGWYSLYNSDGPNGAPTGDKLANVYLAIGPHGNVYIEA